MKKKINLYFYYIGRNLLWSIFLILKEEKVFPRLIFLNDISRYKFDIDRKYNSSFLRLFLRIFFIKQLNLFQDKFKYKEPSKTILEKIKNIYENNISFDNKSLFISRISKVSYEIKTKLFNCYLNGKDVAENNKNCIHYVFNGRKAPVFMFFEGLNEFAQVRRIEITFKNNKRHVYSTSGYLWSVSNIQDVESKYGFDNDFSFYRKRIKGLDHDGKKFVTRNSSKSKYQNFDVSFFLSSPYEFIGFSHTSKEFMKILKFSLREIIRIRELGYKCIIRNHPNFKNSNYLDKKLISNWFNILRKKGIVISDYDEAVSSYDIAKKSKVCLTIGSTIGGELSYLGKNVYDFNSKSESIVFNIVKPYKFEKVIEDLSSKKICDLKSDFPNKNYKRFSGYKLGWGYEIPSILQIGL